MTSCVIGIVSQRSCPQGDLPGGGAQCTCIAVTFLSLSSQQFHQAPDLNAQSIDKIAKKWNTSACFNFPKQNLHDGF